jgi:hypothetical protein
MGVKPIVTASALALGFGALWAAPGLTSGSAPAATAEPQPKANDTSRRVCRNLVRSGTRLSTRYCRTQAEWDAAGDARGAFSRKVRKRARSATANLAWRLARSDGGFAR